MSTALEGRAGSGVARLVRPSKPLHCGVAAAFGSPVESRGPLTGTAPGVREAGAEAWTPRSVGPGRSGCAAGSLAAPLRHADDAARSASSCPTSRGALSRCSRPVGERRRPLRWRRSRPAALLDRCLPACHRGSTSKVASRVSSKPPPPPLRAPPDPLTPPGTTIRCDDIRPSPLLLWRLSERTRSRSASAARRSAESNARCLPLPPRATRASACLGPSRAFAAPVSARPCGSYSAPWPENSASGSRRELLPWRRERE